MKTREQINGMVMDGTMRMLRLIENKLAWTMYENPNDEPFVSVQFPKNRVNMSQMERELTNAGWQFNKWEYERTILYEIGTLDDPLWEDNNEG